MRIAQIASTVAPIRRGEASSVEALVWDLGREFTRLGHEVTTFGARGSEPCGRFIETVPAPTGQPNSFPEWHMAEWVNICRAMERSEEFDVIHAHSYLWTVPVQNLSRTPIVHTLHILARRNLAPLWNAYPKSIIGAISAYQWHDSGFQPAAVIHHGVDPEEFRLQAQPDNYVCYLGRFIASKGPREAIQIAKAAGRQIILAGPRNQYFDEHVAPLVDGEQVQYRGVVAGDDRSELLRNAACLVYPILAPEPFGLVLIEAMMCGTPVAALRLGAVPEIVDEGLTGFTTELIEGLPECIANACTLDRTAIRARAEKRFTSRRMAQDYVRLFERVLEGDFR